MTGPSSMKERRCCTSPAAAEAYAGFVVDVEEHPEGLRFGVGPPDARSKEEPG
jgi:hypothetical protein